MKEKLFNIVVYSMLAYTVAVAGYGALPTEYQNMIPFNWVTALVSGGTTGLLGTAGLLIKSNLHKADIKSTEKFSLLMASYEDVKKAYKDVTKSVEAMKHEYESAKQELARTNKLLEIELKAKLSNKLIDKEVRELIEGGLNEV